MAKRYTDRSRDEAFRRCPMFRYWNYDAGERGYVSTEDSIDLAFGIAIHEGLADILQGGTGQSVTWPSPTGLTGGGEPISAELQALGEGLLQGWYNVRLPLLLEEYDVIGVEQSVEPWCIGTVDVLRWSAAPYLRVEPSEVWYGTRLDGVLRRKEDGIPFVLEFKTSGSPYLLMQQLKYDAQLMLECKAARQLLQEDVGGVVVQIFDKGYKKDGLRRSPFTYLYQGAALSFEWKAKAKLVPAWKLDVDLLSIMPSELLQKQFSSFGPVFYDEQSCDAFIKEMLIREQLSANGVRWHDPKSCFAYGKPCPFIPLCYEPFTAEDPLGSKLFVPRKPHHKWEEQ